MSFVQLWRGAWIVAALVVGIALLAGCSAGGGSSGGTSVTVLKVDVPVEEPAWDRHRDVLLALVGEEPRVARIDPETGNTALSKPLEDVGENIVPSPEAKTNHAYLPQPKLGRVAVISVGSLRKVSTFKTDSSPARVTTDIGSELLFALSEDGSTVTGVNLETYKTLFPPVEDVRAGKEAEPEGPARGLAPEFIVAGPQGIVLYEGHSVSPLDMKKVDDIGIRARAVAGDPIMVTRVYVGEEGSDRLLAVGLNPQNFQLTVAAQTRLGEPVEYVGADQKRVYAATKSKLVVLKTETFENFEENGFEVVDTVHFRHHLKRETLKDAPLSGLAVGLTTEKVYLALKGEPYIVSIDKPDY